MRRFFTFTVVTMGLALFALHGAAAQSRSTLELGTGTQRGVVVEQLQSGTVAPGAVAPTLAPSIAVAPTAQMPGTPQEASLLLPIQFGFDSDVLRPEARAILNVVAAAMADPALRNSRFLLEGHTDATGSWEYNRGLSQRRANAVAQYLIQQGVARDRLLVIGYSWNRLIPGLNPRNAAHRRVEIGRLAQ